MTEDISEEDIEKLARIREELDNISKKKKPSMGLFKKKEEPEVEKKVGLKQRMEDLDEKISALVDDKKATRYFKKKKFKVPWKVKSQLKRAAIKGKVQVILLQPNKNIKPTIGEIKNGMLLVGDKETRIHNGSPEFVWLWNGKIPTVILPEWDLNPISPSILGNITSNNKSWADPETIIIRAIEYNEALQPKKLSGKALIWILIAAAVGIYIFFYSGK